MEDHYGRNLSYPVSVKEGPFTDNPTTQMSESFRTAAFLALSGGLQDAYSYCARGEVFANAQTGNIVLLSQRLFRMDWSGAMHYLLPLCAFALGIYAAERIRYRSHRLHWRQVVLAAEIVILALVGLLPGGLDALANAAVSFSCAMQVQAFRKVDGYAYASTMCIGNLRAGMEALASYRRTKEPSFAAKAKRYFGVILFFGLGAALGGFAVEVLGLRAIWCSCGLLAVSFALMSTEKGGDAP